MLLVAVAVDLRGELDEPGVADAGEQHRSR
jgi:hypothetical protein